MFSHDIYIYQQNLANLPINQPTCDYQGISMT